MAFQTSRNKGMRLASTDSDCSGGQGPPRAVQPMMMMMMMTMTTTTTATVEAVVRNSKCGNFFQEV